ncbi:MAG: hypothetical protein J0I06_06630 [Planctomycetes bacterium]|nr:hypothetical protein [Planctomycetota bacterium]
MRQLSEAATIALWTIGFALVGSLVGGAVFSACEWACLVRSKAYYTWSLAGGASASVGTIAGAVLGFGWSAQECSRRPQVVPEDELW